MTEHGTRRPGGSDTSGILPVLPRLPASFLVNMKDPALPSTRRREALGRVYDHAYRVVAVVLGRSAADVDDAAQDAFMSILKASGEVVARVGPDADMTSWVNTIAARKAIDYRRRSKVRTHSSIDDVPTPPLDAPWPDEIVALTHLAGRVLTLLDESERAVIVLRYWGGQTDGEIARSLGLPLGTVKTQLRRAIDMLADNFGGIDAMQSYDMTLPPARDGAGRGG